MRDENQQIATFWNNIAHDFDAIYSGKKNPLGRFLDKTLRKDIYERYDWVMERAGDMRGKTVCDVGCGSGRFIDELVRRGATRAVGVDVAPEMLKLARDMVTQSGRGGACEFHHADVLNWRTNEKFDLTIAIGFWDYIADPPERLRLIRQFTTGKFLSAWPRYWTWRMPVRKVRLKVAGCPVYFFKKEQVYSLLQGAGFEVTRCDTVGKLFCVESRPV